MSSPIPRAGLTPRAKVLLPMFLIVLLVASYYRVWRARDVAGPPYSLSGRTMGTTYSVVIENASLAQSDLESLGGRVQQELDRIEGLMSTYRSDSELSAFNEVGAGAPFVVSADTLKVVQAAQVVAAESGGAFDITVGPLVALWGFGAGARATPPEAADIERARALVGYQLLTVDAARTSLTKTIAGLRLDLSAIAKGYAVDRVTELLLARQLRSVLVEVGGELRAEGYKTDGQPWRLGIERPDEEARATHSVVPLTGYAMATSGDYRNYYEKDGRRVSHTIDPRTARPIEHHLASVTVLHKSAMWADGYATMFSVLGPDEGLRFAEQHDLAVMMLVRRKAGGFGQLSSSQFGRLTAGDLRP